MCEYLAHGNLFLYACEMGIAYQSDKDKHTIFIVWNGVVTWDDWQGQIHKMTTDPDWAHTVRLLADLGTVTDSSSIGDQQVEKAVALFAASPALSGKRAAIVAREEFRRAGRFSAALAHFGASSLVFNSLDTACVFLGVDLLEARENLEVLRKRLREKENRPPQ